MLTFHDFFEHGTAKQVCAPRYYLGSVCEQMIIILFNMPANWEGLIIWYQSHG